MATLATQRALGSSALSYGATMLPAVSLELSRWRARAQAIPSSPLRTLALAALRKRGNMKGAALFAVLAPRAARNSAVRALVAFQAAYNYLDALAEQPSANPVDNGARLHGALVEVLDAQAVTHGDYYAHNPERADGGYLREMVDTARACLCALPSYPVVAPQARAAAARIVAFQSLNLGERQGGPEALERWGRAHTPPGSDLSWWETSAAAGSSLGVHALIALAAQPRLDRAGLDAVDRAYFPWIGALHSLLDSLVDVAEDRREGQRNLLGYYASSAQAAAAMGAIARRARAQAAVLARGQVHETIITAMVAYYLSAPEAAQAEVRPIAASIAESAGPLVGPTLAVFKAARGACRPGRSGVALARG